MQVTLNHPEYLWLLLVIPAVILLQFYGYKFVRKRALRFANIEALERALGSVPKISKGILILVLRISTIVLLVLALCGPVLWYKGKVGNFDCVFAIDISGSMLATDFEPNRLEAAKQAATSVLNLIPADSLIGVVAFSGVPLVKQGLTDDRVKVFKAIEQLSVEPMSGTAIGDALIACMNLFHGTDKSRIVVLLTDGQNTVGTTLDDAIYYLNKNGVVVYPIGIATEKGAYFAEVPVVTKLDVEAMKKLADETGGKFFQVSDVNELKSSFESVLKKVEGKVPFKLGLHALFLAFLLVVIEWGFINTRYRRIP